MPKSKIVLLGPTPPPYGGVAIFVSALWREVSKRGVKLWTFSDEGRADERITYLKPFRLKLLPALMHEAFKARIIDSSYFAIEHPHKILLPMWIVGKLVLRFEWVKIFHDGSLPSRYSGFSSLEQFLVRAALKRVTEIIVVNEALRDWFRNELGVTQKISVIASLLPLAAGSFDGSLPESIDKAIARRAKTVCSIGVFIPGYGFKEAAEAVARIREDTKQDIGLVLIDCGYVQNLSYEREVFADRDWIIRLANLPQPTVLQVLKRSNVFVRPFGLESYGLSRVEAIWCGVPVVATRAGETRGMLLYDYGDQDAMVGQIKAALADSFQPDTEHWAAVFRTEAEANLQKLVTAIGLGENS